MPKRLIYKLKIGAFNPDSIPMSRLSEYMFDLAGLLGEKDSVHFHHLEVGSTVLAVTVETEAIPKVSSRVSMLNSGDAPDDLRKIFAAIDKRLSDDNATGELRAYPDNDELGAEVILFPGRDRPKPIDYGVISERGSLDGIPMSIGGKDKTKHIKLYDGDREYTGIDCSLEVAARIAEDGCLFQKVIRLHGVGNWYRNSNGEWELKRFRVGEYEILDDTPLAETLNQLRAVSGSGWTEEEHAAEYLQRLRDDPDERPH